MSSHKIFRFATWKNEKFPQDIYDAVIMLLYTNKVKNQTASLIHSTDDNTLHRWHGTRQCHAQQTHTSHRQGQLFREAV